MHSYSPFPKASLESELSRTTGVQFKLLFFLAARPSPVRQNVSAIATSIGAHRSSVRAAIKELITSGRISRNQSGLTVRLEMPAPKKRSTVPPSPGFASMFDALLQFQKTIREPLHDAIVNQCIEIGAAWGMNAYSAAEAVYESQKWRAARPNKEPPRAWVYISNGLQKFLREQAEKKIAAKRAAAEESSATKRKIADIASPPLRPFEDSGNRIEQLATSKSLSRTAKAG